MARVGEPGRVVSLPRSEDAARSDDELMLATRAGERTAFDTLVRRHQRRVIGFAYKFFRHWALANDVAQESFVDVLRAVPGYRADGHFLPFLYRVTLNRCRMAARARKYEESAQTELAQGGEEAVEQVDRDRDRAVQAAMTKLTSKQREILLLRFWSGLSHEEMAETLGISVGTTKSRLFSAMGALRKVVSTT